MEQAELTKGEKPAGGGDDDKGQIGPTGRGGHHEPGRRRECVGR